MTRQESFKRRIRARMASNGERYGAARRALIEQATAGRPRVWAAEPGMSDDAVREATGRGWDQWRDVLDGWPGRDDGHTAIAAHLRDQHGVDGWWAQTVTVGYERISGRRLPHQRSDGTFSVGKSRTVVTDADALRQMLLDDADRAALFPQLETDLRSRSTSSNVRLAVGGGTAEIALEARADGRVKVTIQHERLRSPADVEQWRDYWSQWLAAIDDR